MIESTRPTFPLEEAIIHVTREINALARFSNPDKVSWQKAKRAILRAATALRHQANEISAPIRLREVARIRKIRHTEYFRSLPAPDAALTPTHDGFSLRLCPNQPRVRYRFSVGHEIGHTFFYDLAAKPPARLLVYEAGGYSAKKEEDICHAFARELLMPAELVEAECESIRIQTRPDLLFHLADRFLVSAQVAAARLLRDLAGFETVVAIFADATTRYSTIPTRILKFYGKALRSPRKREKAVIERVVEIIADGSVPAAFDKLAERNSDLLDLRWRATRSRDYRGVSVLLGFHR